MDNHIKGLFPITQAAEVCGLSRILQIQQFQSMGFDYEETAIYFAQGGEAKELLAILENRLNLLQRNVEELRIRAMTTPDISVQMMTLPEKCARMCCPVSFLQGALRLSLRRLQPSGRSVAYAWQGSEGARAYPCRTAPWNRYRGSLYRTGD